MTLPYSYLNGSDHHGAILPSMMHEPANDQFSEQVENYAQKEHSFLRRYLRDVRYPSGVWLQSGEVTLQIIQDTLGRKGGGVR